MTEIGALEAKDQFSRLLARTAQGEAFTITSHGRPVARLVPIEPSHDAEDARAAFARLRARAATLTGAPFSRAEIRTYRDEGRR
ncbi:MAG: type II toxin-antitoxin system prevent-host-death family antitoxin [Azospirillaceae bacterium]|nr:type II toxin-antitoxin system prevent-host-death family antitoxin [Azospirillaceae bacterium]